MTEHPDVPPSGFVQRLSSGYWLVALATLASLLLAVGVWQWLRSEQQRAITTEFGLEAEQRADAIKRQFSSETSVLTALQALYSGFDGVDRAQFEAFTAAFLSDLSNVESVEWVPHRLETTGGRDGHYPVQFARTAYGSAPELVGFDWGSSAAAHAAMVAARDTGAVNAAANVRLPGTSGSESRIALFAPVYKRGTETATLDQRRTNLRGFVAAVLRIDNVVQSAIEFTPRKGIDVYLLDSSAPPDRRVILSILSPEKARRPRVGPTSPEMNAELFHSDSLVIGNSVFTIYTAATDAYGRTRAATAGPLIALAGGLAVTILLFIYLASLADRRERTERVVAQRTAELRTLNHRMEERTLQLEISQRDLRAAKEKAEEATRTKSLFLANMSHEIRTPMNGIVGAGELLGETGLTAAQREYLQMITQSADALLHLINDILDFSKIEAGRLELESLPFGLRDELADTLQAMAAKASDKGLELACHVGPDVPDGLRGDPHRIRQVIINLVGNAIRFTEKGEVVVDVRAETCGENHAALRFAVIDTGPGIAPDKRNLIFQAFAQADSSFTRRFGGTGLGLTIATQLVELMGGRLELESELDKGSTFHFTLPFALVEIPAGKQPREQAILHDLPVLVVDDNETSRRILDEVVRNWGMKPQSVDGGGKALAAMKNAAAVGRPFRLVLLDMMMPDMDGFAVAEQLAASTEFGEPVTIMLSSANKDENARRAQAIGVARFLLKPVRQSDLLETIYAVLGVTGEEKLHPEVAPAGAQRSLRVLVAEDNLVNQRLAQRLLERRGHDVELVGDGAQAVEAFSRGGFDLILMDVQMPGMDGFQATAAIRAKERPAGGHIPIIAMTAHALRGDRERCLEAGMDDYISKPLRAEDFYAVVEGRFVERASANTAE